MNEQKIKLLQYQNITSILFIISVGISIFLTHDEILRLSKKDPVLPEPIDRYINLLNRVFALTIISAILYINYQDYQLAKQQKKTNLEPFKHQISASIFSVISAIIVLYVVIENLEQNPNIGNLENPTT